MPAMQILQLGKNGEGEDYMRETIEALLYGENEVNVWDEKQYIKEEQKIRDLFLNDPEFMAYIARVRTLKACGIS
jgi:hypothetical protein